MKQFSIAVMVMLCPIFLHAGGDPLRRVAKEFSRKMEDLKRPRVGLLSFPYHDGKTSSGSSILSERLTTYMAEAGNVRVVERSLLKKLLEEQHLSETGIEDPETAQKIGKVLGVDVIVTGTLNDLTDDHTELNARALKADTGEVLVARRVIVQRTWADHPRLPRQVTYNPPLPEPEEKPTPNEAIEIGYPSGRGGGRRWGR